MRLFIAILLDCDTLQRVQEVQGRLRLLGQGRFSRAENLHLTLAFLGEVPEASLSAIRLAMEHTEGRPLELHFDHVGRFKRDGGDIWFIGPQENHALMALHQKLLHQLRSAGFPMEERSFSPHITLARQVTLPPKPDRLKLMGRPFSMEANSMSLMHSERVSGRLTYTQLYQAGFGAG